MNRVRLWMLVTALGCFASGVVIGFLVPNLVSSLDSGALEPDPDENQIHRMASDFDLSADQVRLLRMIFRERQEEEMALLRHSKLEQWPTVLRMQVKNARNKAERRIRVVLTEEQLRKYDEMMAIGNK